jgi:TRAP-type mannitol/chloroaromatic compound transport system permease small subunit
VTQQNQAAPVNNRRRGFRFERVTSVMDGIGTVWVFILLILINLDIVGRVIFNHPIRGVTEIVSLSIVALVFLQIAHTTHVGRLTRSEMLLNQLQNRAPRLGNIVQGIHHLVGAGLFAVLFYASAPMFTKAWKINEYVGAEGDFKAPVWPVKLIILIGCAAAVVEFLLLAWRDFRELRRREELA